jgi:hypothetical protein
VVVTALGVRKETKKIGYSVQEVKGGELIKAREPNPINGLVGKVAGLTVGASAEMLQGPTTAAARQSDRFVCGGRRAHQLRYLEHQSRRHRILHGAERPHGRSTVWLRGINGAIMITTKRGSRDKRGFSMEFNSSTMFDRGFNAIPKVQDEYGPGDHGKYAFVDGKGGGTNDGDYDVWGPKFEGQLIPQYDSPVDPVTGERQPYTLGGPRQGQPETLFGNRRAFHQQPGRCGKRRQVRPAFFAYKYFSKGHRTQHEAEHGNNFNIAGGYNFSDKLRLESYINYNRQYSPNFPDVAYGPNSLIYNIMTFGAAPTGTSTTCATTGSPARKACKAFMPSTSATTTRILWYTSGCAATRKTT